MGSGKSTIGKIIADKLGFEFYDTDLEIIKKSNYASVADIFSNLGEIEFRKLEAATAMHLLKSTAPWVIAGGGGLITNLEIRSLIKQSAFTIFLDTSFEEINKRINKQINENNLIRPLFADISKAKELYELRLPIYRENAKLNVMTDGLTPEEVVAQIFKILQVNE